MGRSAWKGPFIEMLRPRPGAKAHEVMANTTQRSATVLPSFVGHKIGIHNGKQFVPVTIREDMVGFKLGEFVPTRYVPPKGATLKKKK